MKAYLHSVRIAPKKANLVAKMVRGMNVADATEALRRTNKKAARIIETLLLSAVANASHNDRQDPQTMVIKTIVVNQGTAYRRGMPKARGQTRPYRKFLTHIDLVLGFPELEGDSPKKKAAKAPSQEKKNTVKATSAKKAKAQKEDTSSSSDSSAS